MPLLFGTERRLGLITLLFCTKRMLELDKVRYALFQKSWQNIEIVRMRGGGSDAYNNFWICFQNYEGYLANTGGKYKGYRPCQEVGGETPLPPISENVKIFP